MLYGTRPCALTNFEKKREKALVWVQLSA